MTDQLCRCGHPIGRHVDGKGLCAACHGTPCLSYRPVAH